MKRPNFQLLTNGNIVEREVNSDDDGDEYRYSKKRLNRPLIGKKRGRKFVANQREIKTSKQRQKQKEKQTEMNVGQVSSEYQKRVKLETNVLCEKSMLKKKGGPLSETCIENVLKKKNQQELESSLSAYNLDRSSLQRLGLKNGHIDRIYRSMYVYSVGFHDSINQIIHECEPPIGLLTSIWKTYITILEQGEVALVGSNALEREFRVEEERLKQEVEQANKAVVVREGELFQEITKLQAVLKEKDNSMELNDLQYKELQRELGKVENITKRLEENVTKKQTEVSSYRQKYVSLENRMKEDALELRKQGSEIHNLRNELMSKTKEHVSVKTECSRLSQELAFCKRQLSGAQNLAKNESEAKMKQTRACENLKKELDFTLSQMEDLQSEANASASKVIELSVELKEAAMQKNQMERELQDNIQRHKNVDLDLRSEIQQHAKVRKSLISAQTRVHELEEKSGALWLENNKLLETNKALRANVSKLTLIKTEYRGEIDRKAEVLKLRDDQVDEMIKQNEYLHERNTSLRKDLHQKEADLKRLAGVHQHVTANLQSHAENLAKASETITSSEKRIKDLLNEKRNTEASHKKELADIQSQVAVLNKDILLLRKERNKLKQNNSVSERDLVKAREQVKEYQDQIDDTKAEMEKIQNECANKVEVAQKEYDDALVSSASVLQKSSNCGGDNGEGAYQELKEEVRSLRSDTNEAFDIANKVETVFDEILSHLSRIGHMINRKRRSSVPAKSEKPNTFSRERRGSRASLIDAQEAAEALAQFASGKFSALSDHASTIAENTRERQLADMKMMLMGMMSKKKIVFDIEHAVRRIVDNTKMEQQARRAAEFRSASAAKEARQLKSRIAFLEKAIGPEILNHMDSIIRKESEQDKVDASKGMELVRRASLADLQNSTEVALASRKVSIAEQLSEITEIKIESKQFEDLSKRLSEDLDAANAQIEVLTNDCENAMRALTELQESLTEEIQEKGEIREDLEDATMLCEKLQCQIDEYQSKVSLDVATQTANLSSRSSFATFGRQTTIVFDTNETTPSQED